MIEKLLTAKKQHYEKQNEIIIRGCPCGDNLCVLN